MFERILFPTDFSEPSMKVLDYIPVLHEAGTREVVLVHVIDSKEITLIASGGQGFLGTVPDRETEAQKELREEIQHRIIDTRRALERQGVKVTVRTPAGNPGEEIVAAADAEGASLIVIGSHGRSNIRDRLLGTVSEYVIKNAHQPVLVIKRKTVAGR
ncbi:universal stress protein F [Methanoculleus chikugoensis]|jgi:nucleotide-binding universal stress UspA family protein|uniref:Universal stress protein n=2 Tax=Methanoculleus chikugoensis TaxID=118126 RepID=A0A1M4MHS3_9EURY|nr:universal stress protein [Methanoculleus chikugoensis]MDD4567409.1 universal stress protein [Methanoculleus chikugoensis]NMA09858.1 universal stress protein [Methanomicrobiales archaeon]BBL69069.1 universal stress protein [Methanoculleus chikugoensis]SCL74406.1 universal stress protein F [Methanoculleus chikugoensis]